MKFFFCMPDESVSEKFLPSCLMEVDPCWTLSMDIHMFLKMFLCGGDDSKKDQNEICNYKKKPRDEYFTITVSKISKILSASNYEYYVFFLKKNISKTIKSCTTHFCNYFRRDGKCTRMCKCICECI